MGEIPHFGLLDGGILGEFPPEKFGLVTALILLRSWLLVILYILSFSERFSKNVQLIVALTKTFYLYDAFSMFLQHFGGQIVKSVEGKKSDKR